MYVAVKNQTGETVESIELNDAVFNVPMNQSLVHQAMVIYQSNRRQGTHDTKTRAQVSGGGRKPWIQKHTGRARQGSTRAPQWRHGGVVFGPHPRSHRKDLPRRMRRLALKCVLSDKARNDRLVCLDATDTIDGKTRSMADLLRSLNVTGSAVVVTREPDTNVVWAASNLKKIYTLPVNQLNAEALLARETLIMTVDAARWAEETLAVEPHGRRGRKFAAAPAPGDAEEPAVEAIEEPVAEQAPADDSGQATSVEDTEIEDTEASAEEEALATAQAEEEETGAAEQIPAEDADGAAEGEA